MRNPRFLLAFFYGLMVTSLSAQDFLLHGCYWDCPGESYTDRPSAVAHWSRRIGEQAPELATAGFTYIWLPLQYEDTLFNQSDELFKTLRRHRLEVVADLSVPAGGIFRPMLTADHLRQQLRVQGFRIVAKGEPEPLIVSNFLNECHAFNKTPTLIAASIPEWQNPARLNAWINQVNDNLLPATRETVLPRVYDYVLREALRRACTEPSYDVRQIYNRSLRDATALTGFHVITLVNEFGMRPPTGKTSTQGQLLRESLLAYAYTLTNNQLGLPAVYYADYYGEASGQEDYVGQAALKTEIDQLIRAHRQYIFNATSVEYLNRLQTDRQSQYLSAADGADATRALIFQMDGTNTPAGRANSARGRRDVLVAINFADVPLKLVQQVNMSNVRVGDSFHDVLGRSLTPVCEVGYDQEFGIPNAIYIELPPRSYTIWVQGAAPKITLSPIALQAEAFKDYVELSWEVPEERSILGYDIEKSINKSTFIKIGTIAVNAAATGNAAYLFIDDERLPDDEVSYRVKIVKQQGEPDYSAPYDILPLIQSLRFELLDTARPSVKVLRTKSNKDTTLELQAYNLKGERVLHRQQPLKAGVTRTEINMASWPKGLYFISAGTASGKKWTKKIMNL